jgi:flagellar motor switch protein FliM
MVRMANKVFEELNSAWNHIEPIEFKQIGFETNPQFVQIIPPGETVIVISFQIKMLGSSGLLTICYPFVSLEPLVDKLTAQHWTDEQAREAGSEDEMNLRKNLQNVSAQVTAVLGRTDLTVKEFLKLSSGDVVTLDRKVKEPVEITVNGQSKYLAKPGLQRKYRAVEIVGACVE